MDKRTHDADIGAEDVAWREIRELLVTLPLLHGATRLADGAGVGELDSAEEMFGHPLPSEYRIWMSISNGPKVVWGGMARIGEIDDNHSLAWYWDIYPAWKQKGYLPIAADGFGNTYVLCVSEAYNGWRPILFIESIEDEVMPAYVAASDLWHFLKGKFRSELGEEWWPFDEKAMLAFDPNIVQIPEVPMPWHE
jgi:cell wall assembly regulator SMI1